MNTINNIYKKVRTNRLYRNVVKYLFVAAGIVVLEIVDFAFLNSVLKLNYQISTVVSVLVSIILNWYFSKKYVFKATRFRAHTEFVLVGIVSVIGIGIQLVVVWLSVTKLHTLPIIGKVFAICATFFWNFWARQKYIFKSVD